MRKIKTIIVRSRIRVRKDGLQWEGPGLQVLLQPKWRCAHIQLIDVKIIQYTMHTYTINR